MQEKGGWNKNVIKKGKEQKCGSHVLPGSFVNTLQTVFVVKYFLSVWNFLCVIRILCGVYIRTFIYTGYISG